MARGGSGDILSGILGALIAEKSDRSPALSAAAASEIHGLAGERAQQKYGSRAMNAMDILEFLPEVFG
jgi:NAD(P)H-hydrate epimerase